LTLEATRRSGRFRLPAMVSFLARRLVWALVTLLVFVTIVFVFLQVWIPFNFATPAAQGSLSAYYALREALGLDRPLPVQYLDYVGNLVRFDLGDSFTGTPVSEIIGAALPPTLFVFAVGSVLAYLMGDALGRYAAWHRRGAVGGVAATVGVLTSAMFPPFLVYLLVRGFGQPLYEARQALGLPLDSTSLWAGRYFSEPDILLFVALAVLVAVALAVLVRGYARRWGLPVISAISLPVLLGVVVFAIARSGYGVYALDLMFRAGRTAAVGRGSLILALLAFVLISFGEAMFVMRVGVAGEKGEDYVLTARAKGLSSRVVRDHHVARNATAPALAATLAAVPYVLAGMIIIENELQIGGLSRVFFGAVEDADIPLVLGVLIVLGLMGVGLRLLVDVLIAALDPRVRSGMT
jgi:peptide/nickel transport system permease protein